MARKKLKDVDPEARDVEKLSADYNLEKEPLQTGEKQGRTDWRETIVMGTKLWSVRGMFLLSLIVVLIILAVVAVVSLRDIFSS